MYEINALSGMLWSAFLLFLAWHFWKNGEMGEVQGWIKQTSGTVKPKDLDRMVKIIHRYGTIRMNMAVGPDFIDILVNMMLAVLFASWCFIYYEKGAGYLSFVMVYMQWYSMDRKARVASELSLQRWVNWHDSLVRLQKQRDEMALGKAAATFHG